jgi:hypothetical protein
MLDQWLTHLTLAQRVLLAVPVGFIALAMIMMALSYLTNPVPRLRPDPCRCADPWWDKNGGCIRCGKRR